MKIQHIIYIFFVTHKDEERSISTPEPEDCLDNPKFEENEKQLSEVPRVIHVQNTDRIMKN